MEIQPYNSHQFIKKYTQSSSKEKEAEAIIEMSQDFQESTLAQYATITDFTEFRHEMREEFKEFRREMRKEFEEFKYEMREEFKEFKHEMQKEFEEFKHEMQKEFEEFKYEMRKEFEEFKHEIKTETGGLRTDMGMQLQALELRLIKQIPTMTAFIMICFKLAESIF